MRAADPHDDLSGLQTRLGHRFGDEALLRLALTHRSFGAGHNERLEFLGDSVLNLAVAGLIYERLAGRPEGEMSRVRAHLVRQDYLHGLAVQLGLPELIRLGEGESRSGGSQRPSILADALEAVIGAVYLDAGFEQAQALVRRLFAAIDITPGMAAVGKDPKTELQEWLQGRRLPVPAYRIVATRGQAHAQTFEVECAVSALAMTESGQGRSRRAAEQEAARRLLDQLKLQDGPEGSVPA